MFSFFKKNKNVINGNHGTYEENGKKFYYKKLSGDALANEFIMYELAKRVGFDVLKPTYYVNNDTKFEGLVTENYVPYGYETINGRKLLEEYFENAVLSDEEKSLMYDYDGKIHNLNDIWNAIEYYINMKYLNSTKEKREEKVLYCMKKIISIFCFDIITMQCDRHYENWEILSNGNLSDLKFAPLYDNEEIGFYYNDYLESSLPDIISVNGYVGENITIEDILVRFLVESDKEFINIFLEMFNILDVDCLNDAINIANRKMNYSISQIYIKELIKNFSKNRMNIENVLKTLNLIESEDNIHAR